VGAKFVVFPHVPDEDMHDEVKMIDEKMKDYASKLR